jgi:hypothetical protein
MKSLRVGRQVPSCPREQRSSSDGIALTEMVKRYGQLDQPLKKFLLVARSIPPDVLESFVRFEEITPIEEENPALECVRSFG